MANFIEELWNSVFTPGPTPTLLIATNVTFGALLTLLIGLLIATWSIHFLILSILSAGLWGAINWFAREVSLAQAEEESLLKKDAKASSGGRTGASDPSSDPMDTGDDTETELEPEALQREREVTPQVSTPRLDPTIRSSEPSSSSNAANQNTASYNTSAAARLMPDPDREMKKRQRQSMAESTGSLSTDSEWEKVDEDGR